MLSSLRQIQKPIRSLADVEGVPFIGKRAREKIQEILEDGKLARLEEQDTPERRAAQLFAKVHGIGPTSAQMLVERGHRTLDDLRAHEVWPPARRKKWLLPWSFPLLILSLVSPFQPSMS
jgi:DNA polymerase/3'-5' exonuclease PolX